VTVLIEFDNSELELRPGSELDVEIVVDQVEDALLVPSAAVIAAPEGQAVFAVQNGKARLQVISIGLKGKETYEVTEGLGEGDRVIVRPPTDLAEGTRVEAAPINGKND
jgi:multidrug efflux pump subunit AcrA (membrane-fusion protein)